MELMKRANGTTYRFGSEQFITALTIMCKEANYTDNEVYSTLENLENEFIAIHNKQFSTEN